jgi:hypothetical protein
MFLEMCLDLDTRYVRVSIGSGEHKGNRRIYPRDIDRGIRGDVESRSHEDVE